MSELLRYIGTIQGVHIYIYMYIYKHMGYILE